MKSIKDKILSVLLAGILVFIHFSPAEAALNMDDSELTPENAVEALESASVTKVNCETVKEYDYGYAARFFFNA